MGLRICEIEYIHKRIHSESRFDETPKELRRLVNRVNGGGFYERMVSMTSRGLQTYLGKYYISKNFPVTQRKNPCAEIPLSPSGEIT